MIVCLCRAVSDRSVRLVAASGARTIEEVGAACGAGRGCGGCHTLIEDLIEREQTSLSASPCNDCPAAPLRLASAAAR